jgi:hypothetical protein
MGSRRTRTIVIGVGAVTLAVAAAALSAPPEPPGAFPDVYPSGDTYRVAGERDGASELPLVRYPQLRPKRPGAMDFAHYHSSREMEWWMRKWAHDHPDRVELHAVGQSFGGRPILQLTITNKRTGRDVDKPGAYFEGGRHSPEFLSSESAFWLAWHLITRYGEDPQVTRIVDRAAVYVRPINNPDGYDLNQFTAQINRSTVRPHDSDGDGRLDEDPAEDLDGDGLITQMRRRVGAGQGEYAIDRRDPSGAAMRYVGPGEGDYEVIEGGFPTGGEGVDNDGDGDINEDGLGGIDLHRNYPYNWRPDPFEEATGRGWSEPGAGAYPLSEPETREVYRFLMTHPNVAVVNSMDTYVPAHLRAPSTCEPRACLHARDRRLLESFDRTALSFTNNRFAGDVYRTYMAEYAYWWPTPYPIFGHGPDFGYFQFGAVWYGDELWNGGEFEDYDGDGAYAQWELARWCRERGRDGCFVPWRRREHPTLGAVEIGGIDPKFWQWNPAPDLIEPWARRQAMFNLHLLDSLPRLRVTGVRVRRLDGDGRATHALEVGVRNAGRIPTALEIAKQLNIVRPDRVRLSLEGGSGDVLGSTREFFLAGGGRKTLRFRIEARSRERPTSVRVSARSTRGGVHERSFPVTLR